MITNPSVNSQEPTTVLYSSAFSELILHEKRSLIVATWKENSKKLIEYGVKDEINRLLDYIIIHHTSRVIVDVRHYVFTSNTRIQQWINSYYVPRLTETNVQKYGFVVPGIPPEGESDSDPDFRPRVEYFATLDEALLWMNQ
jgi:hypothetical protein